MKRRVFILDILLAPTAFCLAACHSLLTATENVANNELLVQVLAIKISDEAKRNSERFANDFEKYAPEFNLNIKADIERGAFVLVGGWLVTDSEAALVQYVVQA